MVDILNQSLVPNAAQIEEAPGPLGTLDQPPQTDKPLRNFDLPVPGQSLTAPKGQMPYETPPQFADIEDATDYLFEKVTRPRNQKNILRLLDAGMPVNMISESVIMFGASEGKWNMDMAMLLMEPVGIMIAGLGHRAGVNVRLVPDNHKEPPGIDPRPIEKVFKKKLEEKEPREPEMKGLLSRPDREVA